jgi:mRNA-degrading endonuclease RelE of RelBE toxin-antitoxin system
MPTVWSGIVAPVLQILVSLAGALDLLFSWLRRRRDDRIGRYKVVYRLTARRSLSELPVSAETALRDHMIRQVAANPCQQGKALRKPADSVRVTQSGKYCMLYTINQRKRKITVILIGHRCNLKKLS